MRTEKIIFTLDVMAALGEIFSIFTIATYLCEVVIPYNLYLGVSLLFIFCTRVGFSYTIELAEKIQAIIKAKKESTNAD